MSYVYMYACCAHCEDDDIEDEFHDGGHLAPCPDGCNDGENAS